jgi:hypothetical protein
MIEKAQGEPSDETADVTSAEMAEALKSVKSAAPGLAGALDAANLTPEGLANAHERATSEEHNAGPAAEGQANERG